MWQASGAWQADGSRHPTASLARRSGRSATTCRRVLRVGKLAPDHDLTGKALGTGDLPVDHAASLALAVADREELYPEYEADLVGPASRLDHHRYAKLLNTWTSIADDRLNRNRDGEQFERRKLTISDLLDVRGTTSVQNGRFLCVRHHRLRHKGWQVAYDPATGWCQVTSPDGPTSTDDPDPPPGSR